MVKNNHKFSAASLLFVSSMFFCFFCTQGFAMPADDMQLTPVEFSKLPDWDKDDHAQALRVFQKSCVEILKRDPNAAFSPSLLYKNREWQTICIAANKMQGVTAKTSRQFFETRFVPYHVGNKNNHAGIFTGYYVPLIHARLKPSAEFNVPIHALPKDLVKVDLGLFNAELAGKSIVGRIKDNMLVPYPDRMRINNDEIKHNVEVLAWGNNPIDVYFAQIQGSVIVQLDKNKQFMLGYAGVNGGLYTSIGKILISRNELNKENISMQSIREWLLQHPKAVAELLNQNASYVFFKILKNQSPLGTETVPLSAERSLAVDPRYIPLGAPIWLSTQIPVNTEPQSLTPYRRLLMAQDTGGAIKGIVRGDVYWGTGKRAEFIAGHMNSPGEYWILLPRMQ